MAYPTPNLAGDKKIAQAVLDDVVPLADRVRNDRNTLSAEWRRYYRMDRARGMDHYYHGRVKINYRLLTRVRENWVTKLKTDLFPETKRWVAITPERVSAESMRPTLESLFRQYLHQYINLRRMAGPMLRGFTLYGTSVIDLGWMLDEQPIQVPVERSPHGRPGIGYEEQQILHYIGPTVRLVDLLLWYIWPTTVDRTDAASFVFEDQLIEKPEFIRLGKTLIDAADKAAGTQFMHTQALLDSRPVGQITAEHGRQDKWQAERERLASRGLTHRVEGTVDADPDRPIGLLRGYRKAAYEKDGVSRWYWVAVGDDQHVLAVRRMPWWYNAPSYLASRMCPMPNEFYGYGIPQLVESLCPLVDDTLNQTMDAMIWSLNPIVAMDPTMVQDLESVKHRPGARWWVRHPRDAVQWMEPPKESATLGMNAVQGLIALANDQSTPGGSGMPIASGKAARTAAGIQAAVGESLLPVRDVEEQIEDEQLTPMVRRMYRLTQQFLDRDLILRVEGSAGAPLAERKLGREDLVGDVELTWVSANSTANPQVRSMQAINFLQQVSRIPPEMLAQDRKRISVGALVQRIAEDILGTWEATEIVQDVPQQPARDPRLENDLIRVDRGDEVQVSPQDNDQQHLQVHGEAMDDPRLSDQEQAQLGLHLQQHQMAMQAKAKMAQMQGQMQMQQMLQGGAGGPGAGGPPGMPGARRAGGPSYPTMNPGRPAATSSPDDLMRQMPRGMGEGM